MPNRIMTKEEAAEVAKELLRMPYSAYMALNPFVPTKQPNGTMKMERKDSSSKERQKFIVDAMKILIEKGEVFFLANPDRIPARVFMGTEMGVLRGNGPWHTALEMHTQELHIALRYEDYLSQDSDETRVYMSIRDDLEQMTEFFDDFRLKP